MERSELSLPGYFFGVIAHSTTHFIGSMSLGCMSLQLGLYWMCCGGSALPLPSITPLVNRFPCASGLPALGLNLPSDDANVMRLASYQVAYEEIMAFNAPSMAAVNHEVSP